MHGDVSLMRLRGAPGERSGAAPDGGTGHAHPSRAAGALSVEVSRMGKRFGPLVALDEVSIRVRAGAFHALLGENGAGKSTLVKCLVGFHPPDAGEVLVDGRQQVIRSPHDAHALGIGMVYQHFTLVPSMTVAENLVMSRGDVPAIVRWSHERERLQAFMETVPFRVPLERPVSRLAAGEKQKVEILKQLYLQRRFMILDEPTSVLTPGEADEVLGMLRQLTVEGALTVLMITHKFREVMAFADTVSVLRRGRLSGEGRVADLDPARLATLMVGERILASAADSAPSARRADATGSTLPSQPAATLDGGASEDGAQVQGGLHEAPVGRPVARPGEAEPPSVLRASATMGNPAEAEGPDALAVRGSVGVHEAVAPGRSPEGAATGERSARVSVRGLVVRGDSGAVAVDRFNLELRPGEIVGLAGVSGNGQRELVEALVGQRAIDAGEVWIDGARYRASREDMRRHRVFSLPEEPLRNACVASMSVAENMALRNFDCVPLSSGGWLRPQAMRAQAERLIEAFRVNTRGPDAAIGTLSGGNVQRAVLARELSAEVGVLIVANPIFGLDFAAVAEIHARLRVARDAGAAVLLVSEDLDELLEVSDRMLVMSGGRVLHETATAQADLARIGRCMAGHAEAA